MRFGELANTLLNGVTTRVATIILYLLKNNSVPWSYLCISLAYLCGMLIVCVPCLSFVCHDYHLCAMLIVFVPC